MRYQTVSTPLITSQARIKPRVLRPVVMHAVREYLPLTENWIFEQIRHASGYFPVVVCDEKSNMRDFPLADVFAGDERRFADTVDFINKVHRRMAFANWPGAYRGVVKRYQPQLIHAHFGDRGVLMLGTALRFRIPMITTFYGYDVSKLPLEEKWVPRLKWLFEKGELFLAEGPCLRQKLIDIGCPPEKARVHHLGVDVRRIPFQERHAPDGPVRLLMAASFREKKGLRYGLEAFARLAKRRPGQLQLTIIGDGPLKKELRELAKSWGVQNQVRWLGYQPHEVFLREALDAHLFISPSVVAADGDTEGGAPVAIIEAQATGLPILATTHADIPEVTRPGKSALLVPERDVDALTERLEYMVDHPELWAAMGLAGRRHVVAEFNATEQGKRLEAIYREVMRKGR